jgi:HK97 family phage major capsid protein
MSNYQDKLTEVATGAAEVAVDAHEAVKRLERDVSQYRLLLDDAHKRADQVGRTTEDQVLLADYARKAWAHKTGATVEPLTKAASDMIVETDARGGYLVPTTVANSVDAQLRLGGDLIRRCSWVQVEPGREHRIPYYSTAPTAAWQLSEGGALTEMDVQIGALERKPHALGGYVDVSHQLMSQSAHDFVQTFQAELLAAIRQAMAEALIQGDDSGSYPYDGLLVASGTTSLDPVATMSPANLSSMITSAVSANNSLYETGVVLTTPQAAEALVQADASTNYTGRCRYEGGQLYFGRWPVVVEPSAYYSDAHHVLFLNPAHVHIVRFGYTLLVDDRSQIKNLLNTVALVGWYGYGISHAGAVCKAEVSALA